MPRQFYFTGDPATFDPEIWRGNWGAHSDRVLLLDTTKTTADPDAYTIQSESMTASTWDTTPGTLGYRAGMLQLVSGPLLAQWISGTLQALVGVFEDTVDGRAVYGIHAWVTQGDTNAVRAILLNNFTDDTSEDASVNQWPSDIPKGRKLIQSAALNATYIEDGDRIVIEIGMVARNPAILDVIGTMYYGTDYYSNGSPDMEQDG